MPTQSKANTSVVPMHVHFTLPALKITPSLLNLGSLVSGSSLHSILKIDNVGNLDVDVKLCRLLNS